MSTVYLLVEVFEFAARVAQEELAFNPDGEAEDVGEEQSAVKRDALEVAMQDEVAPRREEVQGVHEPEAEREEEKRSDEDSVGEHGVSSRTPGLRGRN